MCFYSTELFIQSVATRKVLKMKIWGILRLVDRYCSNLLPKQALATVSDKRYKTWRQTG